MQQQQRLDSGGRADGTAADLITDHEALLRLADAQHYRGKYSGKNQVATAATRRRMGTAG